MTMSDQPNHPSSSRLLAAEAIGTMILMLGGPGVAIVGINGAGGGLLAVSLGFGFALLVAAYTIGHVSGCHINPAVTVGLWLAKKIKGAQVPIYLAGQVIGALVGGLVIWLVARGGDGDFDAAPGTFAANLWDKGSGFFGFWPMVVTEVILTGLLVFAVLSTTRRGYSAPVVGLHVGITLALIHMISIPIDNTSVNPARSLGTAVFAGGDAIEQLWAFVVFPLIGAGLGVLLWLAVDDAGIEDTALAGTAAGSALVAARGATDRLTDRLDAAHGDAPVEASGATGSSVQGFAAVAADPAQAPYGAGSHSPLVDGSAPAGYTIKGNADSMLYHRPDSRNYGATRAEVWFDSPERAETAGFRLASTHPTP